MQCRAVPVSAYAGMSLPLTFYASTISTFLTFPIALGPRGHSCHAAPVLCATLCCAAPQMCAGKSLSAPSSFYASTTSQS
jgi:hypothetical protein